jgi:hypothetical protein
MAVILIDLTMNGLDHVAISLGNAIGMFSYRQLDDNNLVGPQEREDISMSLKTEELSIRSW